VIGSITGEKTERYEQEIVEQQGKRKSDETLFYTVVR
jgi:hypothetical protein